MDYKKNVIEKEKTKWILVNLYNVMYNIGSNNLWGLYENKSKNLKQNKTTKE